MIRGRRYQRESYFPFGPRTHLYSFKCSQSWQEQLAEQGPQTPLLGGRGLPFPGHHSLSAVVHRCPVVWPAGCCRNKSTCPENLCILLIKWFVQSLGSSTGPGKGWELNTFPSRQTLSLFYCAKALGGFGCKLQGAQIGDLVQPFDGFQSLVLLCCSVHVSGSV